ncbi:MAG: 50S ribosomal protein L10 [Clostridia bacterium]|nr:50S ribosomal protein L10 [Clostridia bacterium]
MASEKVLQEKQAIVEQLAGKLADSTAGVIVEYKGISVADDTVLRRKLREAGVDYAVVKNSMLRRAAEKAGLEGLEDVLKGTTALAVSADDPVAAAKILCQQAKEDENFKVKAGFLDGAVIDAARVNELAKLPSREGLISMLLSVLNGPIRGLAVALNAIAEKEGEAAPAAE